MKNTPDFPRENSTIFEKWISSFAMVKRTFFQNVQNPSAISPPTGCFSKGCGAVRQTDSFSSEPPSVPVSPPQGFVFMSSSDPPRSFPPSHSTSLRSTSFRFEHLTTFLHVSLFASSTSSLLPALFACPFVSNPQGLKFGPFPMASSSQLMPTINQ